MSVSVERGLRKAAPLHPAAQAAVEALIVLVFRPESPLHNQLAVDIPALAAELPDVHHHYL